MIRMRFCTLDTIYHAAYYTSRCILHNWKQAARCTSCTLPSMLWSTLRIALDCTLLACLTVRSQLLSMAHSQPAWLYAPNCSRWHTPSLLDLRSHVSSQDAPKYTPSTLPSTPPSMFSGTLPITLSSTLPIALDDTLPACLTIHS